MYMHDARSQLWIVYRSMMIAARLPGAPNLAFFVSRSLCSAMTGSNYGYRHTWSASWAWHPVNVSCTGTVHRAPIHRTRGRCTAMYRRVRTEAYGYALLHLLLQKIQNHSGCGNTINANDPAVQELILHSLRTWVEEYHVDGFRFDLASCLCRGTSREIGICASAVGTAQVRDSLRVAFGLVCVDVKLLQIQRWWLGLSLCL